MKSKSNRGKEVKWIYWVPSDYATMLHSQKQDNMGDYWYRGQQQCYKVIRNAILALMWLLVKLLWIERHKGSTALSCSLHCNAGLLKICSQISLGENMSSPEYLKGLYFQSHDDNDNRISISANTAINLISTPYIWRWHFYLFWIVEF